MPGVANILSIDLRSNPPQQQQRSGEENSFSSLLQTNSDDVENETPKVSQREQPDRPNRGERSATGRANHRREPDRSSPKDDAQADAPKSGETDAASAKDGVSNTDDNSSATNSDGNNQQTGTDTSTDTTILVAPSVVSAVDPAIQVTADLNLSVAIGAAAPVAQSDASANETATPQATDLSAVTNVAPSAVTGAAAVADTALAAAGADIASATAVETTVAAAGTGASATTDSTATAEVAASSVSSQISRSVADAPAASNDPAIQIAVAASTSNAKKMAGDTSVDAAANQNGTTKADVATSGDSALPEAIAPADPNISVDTPKAVASNKETLQFGYNTPVAKTAATAMQTATAAASEPRPDAKEAAASAVSHPAIKANAESEIDFSNSTLRFDPVLVRHLPQVNPTILMPEPVTLNPATEQFQAQTIGTTNQSIPLTSTALAVEIVTRAKDGSRQFEIRLDPPELGRIDVRLDVGKGGDVSTRLTADRQETLDLLQRDSRELERALQSAGLKTGDGDLSFSLRQQTADGSANERAQTQDNARSNLLKEDSEPATVSIEQYQWAARLRGGVDIRI